jgi:hypothetical protein
LRGRLNNAANEFGRWSDAVAGAAEVEAVFDTAPTTDDDEVAVEATRSQEGHIDRVVAGKCM